MAARTTGGQPPAKVLHVNGANAPFEEFEHMPEFGVLGASGRRKAR